MVAAQQQAAYVEAQNKANRDAYLLSKQARERELQRQKDFERDAADYWKQTMDKMGVDEHDKARDDATNEFVQTFDEQVPAIPEGQLLSGQKFANDTVKTEIAKRTNKAAAEARERVQALARLTSFGTVDTGRAITLNNSADRLSTLNGIRRGSLGASQQEQNIAPAQVSPGSSIFGDVLSGLGGIVSSYGGGPRVPYSPVASAAIASGYQGGIY